MEVKTIILLGGRATRMRPLSVDKDKSMIFFMGKPLLSYLIEDLKLCGLLDIMLTSSGKNGEIKDYFSDGKKFGVSIEYYDGEFYGTAGTVKKIIDGFSETLMVIYGDNLMKADFEKMVRFHLETESGHSVAMEQKIGLRI
jgi:mannose-1-phosphate guanylyltransferase/phosphomannomutase